MTCVHALLVSLHNSCTLHWAADYGSSVGVIVANISSHLSRQRTNCVGFFSFFLLTSSLRRCALFGKCFHQLSTRYDFDESKLYQDLNFRTPAWQPRFVLTRLLMRLHRTSMREITGSSSLFSSHYFSQVRQLMDHIPEIWLIKHKSSGKWQKCIVSDNHDIIISYHHTIWLSDVGVGRKNENFYIFKVENCKKITFSWKYDSSLVLCR